jgi:cytochrome c2
MTPFEYQNRVTEKSAWMPVDIAVRWTKGEGAIIPYIDKLREAAGVEASPQFGPPRLTSEGMRVQPDWLYVFLKNVHQIRPSLAIRMPSFWAAEDPLEAKHIYKPGRLSALVMENRPTGLASEPVPLTDQSVPDDVGEIVEYFNQVADEKPYGYQPRQYTLDKAKEQKEIEKLLNVVAKGGRDCAQCHVVGGDAPAPTQPIGPDLTRVKWRIKSEWLRRWLIDPASLLPGTKMPSNFLSWGTYEYDPAKHTRGLLNNDAKMFDDRVKELDSILYYLMHLNEPPR